MLSKSYLIKTLNILFCLKNSMSQFFLSFSKHVVFAVISSPFRQYIYDFPFQLIGKALTALNHLVWISRVLYETLNHSLWKSSPVEGQYIGILYGGCSIEGQYIGILYGGCSAFLGNHWCIGYICVKLLKFSGPQLWHLGNGKTFTLFFSQGSSH